MINDKDYIKTIVRVRQLLEDEEKQSQIHTVRTISENVISVLDPVEYNNPQGSNKNRNKSQNYDFTQVFGPGTTQDEFYGTHIKNSIEDIKKGFNSTILAYGATGTGKTYTMLGTSENPGMMVKASEELLSFVDANKDKEAKLLFSYIEIYNENIKDLIDPKNERLQLREDKSKGTMVIGASEMSLKLAVEVFKLLA